MILRSTEKRFIPLVLRAFRHRKLNRGSWQGSEHPVKLEKYGNVTIIIKGYSLLKAEEAPSAISCSVRPEGLTALAERRHRVRWKAPPAGTRCQFAGCPPGAADDRKRSLRGPVAKQQGR